MKNAFLIFCIAIALSSAILNAGVAYAECNDKLDIVFVLDTSFSMNESCGGATKITCLKDATKTIIDSSLIDEDRISIFRFSSDVEQIIGLKKVKNNRDILKGNVSLLEPAGWTALGDGLKEGLEYLNESRYSDSKSIIILLTDGMVTWGDLNTSAKVEDYISENWKNGPIEIYTIGVGESINKNMLQTISEYTHGKFYSTDSNCYGQCIANLFSDSIVNAKGGFRVSYLLTTCAEPLTKTIVFDSCLARNDTTKSIRNIKIVDSFDDSLKYVANSGNVTYLTNNLKQSSPLEPALTVGGGKKTLTFDINNIDNQETRVIVDFKLNGSEDDFESVYGTKDNASVNYKYENNNYELRDNTTFKIYCGCPVNPICDGKVIGNNPNCAQDEYSCDISWNNVISGRKFGYRDQFGNCTAKPGCYCVEDPWQWTIDPQYSKAACECIAGYNMWESSTSKCCSIDECFVSDDATWVCDKGTRKDGFFFCEKISACGRELYWNETNWSENIPDGCDCAASERCGSGVCLTGKCLTPENPNISFTYESIAMELGSKTQTVIYVKNNLAVEDTIDIKVYASPEKFMNWIKFKNGETAIGVNLERYEDQRIVLDMFAGETGSYTVKLVANSRLSANLYATDEQYIQVMYRDKGITTDTPDIQWIALLVILFIAIAFVSDRYAKKGIFGRNKGKDKKRK